MNPTRFRTRVRAALYKLAAKTKNRTLISASLSISLFTKNHRPRNIDQTNEIAKLLCTFAKNIYFPAQHLVSVPFAGACFEWRLVQRINSSEFDAVAEIHVNTQLNWHIITFQGTNAQSDWFYNLDFTGAQVEFAPLPDGQVHSGFQKYYKALRFEIVQYVCREMSTIASGRLFITGHSMGGALANLASLDLSRAVPHELYTFGAPMVFQRQVAEYYRFNMIASGLVRAVRYVSKSGFVVDPVPALPPLGYEHVGEKRLIKLPVCNQSFLQVHHAYLDALMKRKNAVNKC